MSFSWVPYYKELARKLVQYRDKREELLDIVKGLDDEFVSYLQKDKDKNKLVNIHPFAFFSIFGRLTDINKKTKILEYFKNQFDLTSAIPTDYDGIPSILPNNSFWSMPWNRDYSQEIEENWDLFCCALEENFDKNTFIKYFDKVKNQKDVKSKITHALYRMNPDKFLSIDGNTRKYLFSLEIPVFDEYDLSGKNYLRLIEELKEYMNSNKIKENNFYEFSYNAWIYGKGSKKYWLIAPGENARLWDDFYNNNIIGIGWDDLGDYSKYKNKRDKFNKDFLKVYGEEKKRSTTQVWRFYKEIQEGDYVIAKNGLYQILGIGIIESDYYFDNARSEYKSVRDVKWIKTGEWDYPGQAPQDTVTLLKDEKVKEIMNIINQKDNAQAISLGSMLKANMNLILHGAPGTGKTHLAKDIAAQIICGKSFAEIEKDSDEEKSFNEQTEFVQFHPSYDYTDFVEGLRPIEGENGEVGFERKDGVFKEFCEKALKAVNSGGTDNFEDAWKALIKDLEEKDFIDVPMISNRGTFRVELNEYGTGLANRTYENNEYKKDAWINGKSKFFNKDQLYNIYRGLPGCPAGGHDNYRRAIVNYMKQNYKLKDFVEGNIEINKNQKPYIFIIDEINRGELSKIFGELFFSIESGYRGTKGKVRTQYANMVKGKNEFDIKLNASTFGNFFIPENVYIIGTMNDIDRSVESMDFAMRRRFTFKEIKASDTQEAILAELDDSIRQQAIDKMNALNDAISQTDGLSPAYHIGGAYFKKLENLSGDFDKLWEYHLEPLLREYLRGQDDIEKKLEDLNKTYSS